MKWNETHAGVINAASQRFWVALGDNADAVAVRMNTDPEYLKQLAKFAMKGISSRDAYLRECRSVYLDNLAWYR